MPPCSPPIRPGDGITVLGTTLVMKCFTETPLNAPGVTSHRVGGRWLCGGASNAGAGVLRRFYSDDQLSELSRQINPDTDSGLRLRPLPAPGNGSLWMIQNCCRANHGR